ncbi:MAG: histidine phosphatase family protein, partial [Nocardioides sp.]|nr:histidine phosphatase family protein [Nocardioides sp.]
MGLVLLVRHGQASFGADDYDVLSETGIEQSRVLGRFLADAGLDPGCLMHGAMRRQRETATAMAEAAGWTVVPMLDEGWNEFDHLGVIARGGGLDVPDRRVEGPVTTPDRRAFQRIFEDATARWTAGGHDDEYDETWSAFVGRVRAALDRACERDGVTVVSSSGGPIAAACAALVDPSAPADELPRLWGAFNTVTANASVTRVVQGSTGRRLLTFNEHGHLPREL